MKKGTREIATSFTTLMFLVIAISGVMMFFKFNDSLVKDLHEILGLVFVAASIITIAISSVFIYQSTDKGDNPKMVMMQKVLNAPITDSFKLLNGNYDNAIKKLTVENIKIVEGKSIEGIAQTNKTSPFRIISIITSK